MLNDDQRRELEALLARREAELQAQVREAKQAAEERLADAGSDVKDAVDDGDDRFLGGIEHVQLLRDQEALRDIDEARERLRRGTYGLCVVCAEPIALERLRVQPAAKFCLRHQVQWEQGHPAAPPFTAPPFTA